MEGYEDWDFVQTLGEGAYGEVKLAISTKTDERVAVKIIDTTRDESVLANVKKECAILQMTKKSPHDNIIKFLAYKLNGDIHYIFLELACGGELFDRIQPDEGMERILAHRYFQQLIAGVDHLHLLGITHRDIKPENLLLDRHDNLQITDFGLSTIFRHQGKTRRMERRCGTPPYAAPEVLAGAPYHARPADVWSCGIVLVTMLAGELPWDEPSDRVKEFIAWRKKKLMYTPWTKLNVDEIRFLEKVLAVNPKERLTIEQICEEQWFKTEIPMPEVCEIQKKKKLKRSFSDEGVAMSQPDLLTRHNVLNDSFNSTRHIFDTISFSQPNHPEYMILSQIDLTQGASQATQSILQRLVRRMTRFLIKKSLEQAQEKLQTVLTEQKLQFKQVTSTQYTVSTRDGRGKILSVKIQLLEMLEDNILLDFRLSKGDGIEFKKSFMSIRKKFGDCIVKAPH